MGYLVEERQNPCFVIPRFNSRGEGAENPVGACPGQVVPPSVFEAGQDLGPGFLYIAAPADVAVLDLGHIPLVRYGLLEILGPLRHEKKHAACTIRCF